MMTGTRKFKCFSCGYEWDVPYGTGRPAKCPKCGSTNIHRVDAGRGRGMGRRGGIPGQGGMGGRGMGGRGGMGGYGRSIQR